MSAPTATDIIAAELWLRVDAIGYRDRADEIAAHVVAALTDAGWAMVQLPEASTADDDDLQMDAYYFNFERTGVLAIDRILSAVAQAGSGAHHTQSWQEDGHEAEIQKAANEAAAALQAERPRIDTEVLVRRGIGPWVVCDADA